MERFKISIPVDSDGFVLMKCPICKSLFKMPAEDIEHLDKIFCPCCGMASENFITDDVIALAMVKVNNQLIDDIYSELKKAERSSHGLIKAGKKPKPLPENPIRKSIDSMVTLECRECRKSVKVKPIIKMSGCYCPYCGMKEF